MQQNLFITNTNVLYCLSEDYRAGGKGSIPKELAYYFSGRGG